MLILENGAWSYNSHVEGSFVDGSVKLERFGLWTRQVIFWQLGLLASKTMGLASMSFSGVGKMDMG